MILSTRYTKLFNSDLVFMPGFLVPSGYWLNVSSNLNYRPKNNELFKLHVQNNLSLINCLYSDSVFESTTFCALRSQRSQVQRSTDWARTLFYRSINTQMLWKCRSIMNKLKTDNAMRTITESRHCCQQ